MIRFSNVSKTYPNGAKALENVSFEIEAGSFTFLVGPTGSGKSTILRLLHRDEVANQGTVEVFKQNISKLSKKDIPKLRQRTGVVFQDFKLLPQKTAWENVAFALNILGVARNEQEKRIQGVLELTGITHLKDVYPNEMSGGEQQRVSVARAIINRPPLLLADEPTGNLDPETSWDIVKLLSKICKTGTTVVVSTHNLNIVGRMRRRTLKIEKGRLVADIAEGAWKRGE